MRIEGKVAVVSCGASGLGAATVRRLRASGAKVALFDISEERGCALAQESGSLFVEGSVTSESDVSGCFEKVASQLGSPNILVNCAGIAPSIKIVRHKGFHPLDAFQLTLDVNLTGTFLMVRQFVASIGDTVGQEEDRGVVINTASIAATDGHVGHVAYAASKAGIIGMTLPLARELGAAGIRVMAISPGLFRTPMLSEVPGSSPLGTQVPFPARLGNSDEFAALVELIVRNNYLNGEIIRIDGGLRLAPH